MKWLRGSALDIFGRTPERRMERALIADYEALIEETINARRMLYGLLKKERTWDEPRPQTRPKNNP